MVKPISQAQQAFIKIVQNRLTDITSEPHIIDGLEIRSSRAFPL